MPLDPKKFSIRSMRSSGPGGQGVNTTDSKIEMRLHLESAEWLSPHQIRRLSQMFSSKINNEGELILTSQIHRSQRQNLEECLKNFEKMLIQASHVPRKRIATKATRGSKERRLKAKKQSGRTKKDRQTRWDE